MCVTAENKFADVVDRLPFHWNYLSFSQSVNICSLCGIFHQISLRILSMFKVSIVMLNRFPISGFSNGAIRSIRLAIEPMAIRRGQSATLRCLYDLDGAPLLSLQFYRGSGEFYRFSPTQSPSKKVFPLSGINVDVS